jgi:hypothetical protein
MEAASRRVRAVQVGVDSRAVDSHEEGTRGQFH